MYCLDNDHGNASECVTMLMHSSYLLSSTENDSVNSMYAFGSVISRSLLEPSVRCEMKSFLVVVANKSMKASFCNASCHIIKNDILAM
jgi:hypothetical protein